MSKGNCEKDKKRQRKSFDGWRWSALVVPIVSILVFNTLFLLVLVKILYENNIDGPSQIHDQIQLHINDLSTRIQGDKQEMELNRPIGDSVESEVIMEAGAEKQKEHFTTNISPDVGYGDDYDNDHATAFDDIQAATREARSLVESKEELSIPEQSSHERKQVTGGEVIEEQEGAGVQENLETKSPDDLLGYDKTPLNCWIPFSYILIRNCRHQAREGLPMPLAGAENLAWI